MNTKNNRSALLNLGRELSRNEQKKILGGASLVCSLGSVSSPNLNCSSAAAYCMGTGRGTLISCSEGGGGCPSC